MTHKDTGCNMEMLLYIPGGMLATDRCPMLTQEIHALKALRLQDKRQALDTGLRYPIQQKVHAMRQAAALGRRS